MISQFEARKLICIKETSFIKEHYYIVQNIRSSPSIAAGPTVTRDYSNCNCQTGFGPA